jgi:hypothetical protein
VFNVGLRLVKSKAVTAKATTTVAANAAISIPIIVFEILPEIIEPPLKEGADQLMPRDVGDRYNVSSTKPVGASGLVIRIALPPFRE